MASTGPFDLQQVLTDLYHTKDLLDFSAPGPSSPVPATTNATPSSSSIFSSAASVAAAAGRRAAAVASAAASPQPQGTSTFRDTPSPDRAGQAQRNEAGANLDLEVRCVDGYGPNLYIGRSDGVVEWWVCDGSPTTASQNGWSLRHKHTLFPRRPVSKIVLLPKVSKLFVLSDGTLHAFLLPTLEPVNSSLIPPLRGITSVILDDDELDWAGPGTEEKNAEMTFVVVRRKGLGIYRLGNRMNAVKEIPLPSPPTYHALFSNYLCAAIPSTNTYSIIDLSDASLTEVLPVSQIEALDFDVNPNVVVIPGENEFLVTSYTGASTMGVFLNGQGDPVRGTMEWEDHPLSIAIESGYIIALLRNNTVTVHSLSDLEKPVQTVSLDPSFAAFTLAYSPYGVSVRDLVRDERMNLAHLLLLGGKLAPPETIPSYELSNVDKQAPTPPQLISPEHEEPPSGSGLTPPSSPKPFARQPITPKRNSSLIQATAPRGPFSTTVAETLIVGRDGIQSFAPISILLKLEILCAEGKMDEAIVLVDDERRKGRRGEIDADKATHQATLRLMHLLLACHLMLETMFEKAGDYFIRGKIDPRVLVRLYSKYRGKVIGSAEEVEVFEGLRAVLEEMPSVDEIIANSIKRNYSPHLEPSSEQSPEAVELRRAMTDEATAMLTDFLRKTRQSRRKGGGSRGLNSRKLDTVIDTTLAKLLADAGTTNELLALLASPNDCVLSELEPFLVKRKYVLSTVMRQQGRTDRVLEILREIAESPEGDALCDDPVDEIAQQLETVTDPGLFRRYTLWLVERDADKALAILMAQNPKTGVKLEDVPLIDDLRKISEDAADRYLEHVVVIRRSPDRALHEQLLGNLLDLAEVLTKEDGVKYHLEELDSEYRLQVDPQPYPVFLADIAPATPIKSLRLKLLLFLQGSPFYDLQSAASRLEALPALKPEFAVVLGRLGRNRQALNLLAIEIGDDVSAQTYCTQGGEIIPPKVAHKVAQLVPELVGWATLGDVGRRRRGTVDAKTQEGLVLELLGVYMRDGCVCSAEKWTG
ncbi:hypothetical protein BCR39DRAFT_518520 [Naematelia encephala]|uniref:CNH domain-containing protein n=1 Tax=Naematelia encephala TaxID=71784 RepID=A0A1Y2BH30_9TREE|nr:hypothetical protein BCR39DRAFT_518520 [Naematelia encephala]